MILRVARVMMLCFISFFGLVFVPYAHADIRTLNTRCTDLFGLGIGVPVWDTTYLTPELCEANTFLLDSKYVNSACNTGLTNTRQEAITKLNPKFAIALAKMLRASPLLGNHRIEYGYIDRTAAKSKNSLCPSIVYAPAAKAYGCAVTLVPTTVPLQGPIPTETLRSLAGKCDASCKWMQTNAKAHGLQVVPPGTGYVGVVVAPLNPDTCAKEASPAVLGTAPPGASPTPQARNAAPTPGAAAPPAGAQPPLGSTFVCGATPLMMTANAGDCAKIMSNFNALSGRGPGIGNSGSGGGSDSSSMMTMMMGMMMIQSMSSAISNSRSNTNYASAPAYQQPYALPPIPQIPPVQTPTPVQTTPASSSVDTLVANLNATSTASFPTPSEPVSATTSSSTPDTFDDLPVTVGQPTVRPAAISALNRAADSIQVLIDRMARLLGVRTR